ncbi:SixA phosphatase family protein [Roseobacter sinensis]|uniref:Histidine phosphatase family protein n=1 Tax=Roseobacter sinensis TaxID=2931391 RepID=A0ABT3BJG6_9RHOB|nr:histidine phosphatase family protein [Roseobacter sp. WL0113]MCV3273712.1 histidine phosphatase family protein [Roseobacter sp. WL0113]
MTRTLILMRHAKSDWSHAGLRDHERPLNGRGRVSAQALGAWLRDREHLPDEVLCSSATRTGETLQRLELPKDIPVRYMNELYHAEASCMRDVLMQAVGACVLMIGHNPGICDVAHRLVRTAPDHPRFEDYPTGATLVVRFAAPSWAEIGWHEGQPIDFVTPRELT